MTTAAAANEINHNITPDFTLADAYDAEYMDVEAAPVYTPVDVEQMSDKERWALNATMAEWFAA